MAHLFELGSEQRLDVGLFLKDEAREERDDLLGLVSRKDVLENQLGEDELVSGVDLRARVSWCTRAARGRTSQATRPFRRTVEFSSMNCSSLRTSIRCS